MKENRLCEDLIKKLARKPTPAPRFPTYRVGQPDTSPVMLFINRYNQEPL